ncbi:MAG: hypothetical protein JEZ12_21505 [Desulfobacterium sp.]|nr:hypothetical protein [Desulfobacterium sp.]
MESITANNTPGQGKRLSNGMGFFLIMVGLYMGVGIFDGTTMATALTNSGKMLVKLMPVMGFVFTVNALVSTFIHADWIEHHLGESSGWQGWVLVLGVSMVMPGSPFIIYPLLHELTQKGLKKSLAAVFLYNRTVKITFLPAMTLYFGIRYTVVLSVFILLAAVLNGIIVGNLSKFPRNTGLKH